LSIIWWRTTGKLRTTPHDWRKFGKFHAAIAYLSKVFKSATTKVQEVLLLRTKKVSMTVNLEVFYSTSSMKDFEICFKAFDRKQTLVISTC
jgi:hypothetical protein